MAKRRAARRTRKPSSSPAGVVLFLLALIGLSAALMHGCHRAELPQPASRPAASESVKPLTAPEPAPPRTTPPSVQASEPYEPQTDTPRGRASSASPVVEAPGSDADDTPDIGPHNASPTGQSPTLQTPEPPEPSVQRAGALPATEVIRVPSAGRRVALTLDAGASAAPLPSILSTLRNSDVRITFFLTGKWTSTYSAEVQSIAADGHELANHSWSHPDFTKLSADEMRSQLERTSRIIAEVSGRPCAPLFRPPYGARNKTVLATVAAAGYRSIYWSVDSLDSVRKDITPAQICQRVINRLEPGAIILMHVGSQATAAALPDLIAQIQANGYRIVTVSELLKYE